MLAKDVNGLSLLKKEKSSRGHFVQHDWTDKVFVIEKILEKKEERKTTKFLIKFQDYNTTTWQESSQIPKFIIDNFEKTGSTEVRKPKILEKRKNGTITEIIFCKYYYLSTLSNYALISEIYWSCF